MQIYKQIIHKKQKSIFFSKIILFPQNKVFFKRNFLFLFPSYLIYFITNLQYI